MFTVVVSFKPYYKWITFNTGNGWKNYRRSWGFKPYYKWITFNTFIKAQQKNSPAESFKPYYKWITFNTLKCGML